jgi:hypothetical protein
MPKKKTTNNASKWDPRYPSVSFEHSEVDFSKMEIKEDDKTAMRSDNMIDGEC